LEDFFKTEALPYWRSRGFNVKVFVTQYSLGPAQLWLFTEIESMASFEQWPDLATGEPRGNELMGKLMSMMTNVRGSVVRDLEVGGHGR
jgi:hypothetical protein